jgi:RNA polymerase sigma-70 factor (ECF subfamily)
MMADVAPTPEEMSDILNRAAEGDLAPWGELLQRLRDRLRRMVVLRLDSRLQGRVDPSDVIQEAFIDATRRVGDYAAETSPMPFYLWLRFLVGQAILEQHRRHLGALARDAGREVSLYRGPMPEATSAAIVAHLLGRQTSPSQAAIRAERKIRLQSALNQMDPIDREVLVLRHYEQLSNGEVATVLDLDKSAASKRYARALVRLKDILSAMPGGLQEP